MSQIPPLLLTQLESYAVLLLGTTLVEAIRLEEVDTLSILKQLVPQLPPELRASSYRMSRVESNDVCFNCHYNFGLTVGGRVRNGCPICQVYGAADYSKVGLLILSTGLHPALADLIVARVITKYLPINKTNNKDEDPYEYPNPIEE